MNDDVIIELPPLPQLKNNVYLFFEDINEETAEKFFSYLNQFEKKPPTEDDLIYVYINNEGGDVDTSLAIYDYITYYNKYNSKNKIITIGWGKVYSASVFLLLAGYKRKISKNSFLYFHYPLFESDSRLNSKELESEYKHLKNLYNIYKEIILEKTKIKNEKEVDKLFANYTYMNSEEALKFGFVDEIII